MLGIRNPYQSRKYVSGYGGQMSILRLISYFKVLALEAFSLEKMGRLG